MGDPLGIFGGGGWGGGVTGRLRGFTLFEKFEPSARVVVEERGEILVVRIHRSVIEFVY